MISTEEWLAVCREAGRDVAAATAHGASDTETGDVGAGGDLTLRIDADAEDIVLGHLRALHQNGRRFAVLSEECGRLDFGAPFPLVVLDPIDGSLNAKRGAGHFALSLAVLEGPSFSDTVFGYVRDLRSDEEWWATRDGAFLGDRHLEAPGEEQLHDGRLELVAVETGDAALYARAGADIAATAFRIRVPGSIAIALCHLADARIDGMVNLTRARGVDYAAGAFVAARSGARLAFPPLRGDEVPAIDLERRSSVIAARSETGLAGLLRVAAHGLT